MKHRVTATVFCTALAAFALAACNPQDQTDAKRIANDAVAQAGDQAKVAASSVAAGLDQAKLAASDAATRVGDRIDDAVITTAVKTELAKDASLNPLKISVETDNGRVALKGQAGNTAARDRATTIAARVKGVSSVDNQLAIQPG